MQHVAQKEKEAAEVAEANEALNAAMKESKEGASQCIMFNDALDKLLNNEVFKRSVAPVIRR